MGKHPCVHLVSCRQVLLRSGLLVLTGRVGTFCRSCFNGMLHLLSSHLSECESFVPNVTSNQEKIGGVFSSVCHKC